MPQCFCQSNDCNGKTLGHRAYAKHQREDKARLVDDALSRVQRVCQAQDSAIAAYIGSLTLSDEVTAGVEDTVASRIWCRSADLQQTSAGPSPYAPIDDYLNLLCEIEHELSALILVTRPKLACLQEPLACGDPFPLKAALTDARRIQDRLATVNSRAASVREVKSQISDRLSSFLAELKVSQSEWTESLKNLGTPSTTFPTYKNGESGWFSLLRYSLPA